MSNKELFDLAKKNKNEAIKVYRENTGGDLKSAREYIDSLLANGIEDSSTNQTLNIISEGKSANVSDNTVKTTNRRDDLNNNIKSSSNKKIIKVIIILTIIGVIIETLLITISTSTSNKSTTNSNDNYYTESITNSTTEASTIIPLSEYPTKEEYLKVLKSKISSDTGLNDVSLDSLGLIEGYDSYEINANFSNDIKIKLGRLYLMLDDNNCVISLYVHSNRNTSSGGASEEANRMITYNVAIDCVYVMAKQVDGYYGSTEGFLNNFIKDQQSPTLTKGHCNKFKGKCITIAESTSSTYNVYVAYGDEACDYVESIN